MKVQTPILARTYSVSVSAARPRKLFWSAPCTVYSVNKLGQTTACLRHPEIILFLPRPGLDVYSVALGRPG